MANTKIDGEGLPQATLVGAQVARVQIRVMYEELLARFADISAHGSHRCLRSNHLSGLKSMPVAFTPQR